MNHRTALFASSLPRGFVHEGILHLFDLSLGCLYRLPLEQIGNLESKYETGQPFTVTRSNTAVEQFLICDREQPANISTEEVTMRCGRTSKTDHPPVPPKPVPVPILPKPVPNPPVPPKPPKPVTPAHNLNIPSSIKVENHLSTVPVKPEDESFPWFWITIGVLVFLLATIFLSLVYRCSRQSSRQMAASKSKSGNVKNKKKKKKKTGGNGLKSKNSSGTPKSTSSTLKSKSPGRSKLTSSISKTGSLPSTSSLLQPPFGVSPVSAKIKKKSPKLDDSVMWTSVLGPNSEQTPPTASKTPQSSSSQNVLKEKDPIKSRAISHTLSVVEPPNSTMQFEYFSPNNSKKSPQTDLKPTTSSVGDSGKYPSVPTVGSSVSSQMASSQSIRKETRFPPPPPPSSAAEGPEQETLLTTILGAPPITSPTSSRSRSQRPTSQVRSTTDYLEGFLSVVGSSRAASSSSTVSSSIPSIIGFTEEEDRAASEIPFEVATNSKRTATYQEGGLSKRGRSRRSPINKKEKERGKYG